MSGVWITIRGQALRGSYPTSSSSSGSNHVQLSSVACIVVGTPVTLCNVESSKGLRGIARL
jgi:hypothetical protein